jgi:hypothetical protein
LLKNGKGGTDGLVVDVVILVYYAIIDIESMVASEVVDD